MKNISGTWFEVGVKYRKADENGEMKKVSERYCVDAQSFTEAEARINETQMAAEEDFEITSEIQTSYNEILLNDADNFYKINIQYIFIDEKTEKEKRQGSSLLVNAETIGKAVTYTDDFMRQSMQDYTITAAKLTKIVDIVTISEEE